MKVKSLKQNIITMVVLITLFFSIITLSITIISFFNLNNQSLQHSQKEILIHVKNQINDFMNKIEKLSVYLENENENLHIILEPILNTNKEISTILLFNENNKVEKIYSKTDIYLNFLNELSNDKINIKKAWSDLIYFDFQKNTSIAYSFKVKKKKIIFLISLEKIINLTKAFKNSDGSSMIRLFDSNKKFIINHDLTKKQDSINNSLSRNYFTDLIDVVDEYKLTKFKNNYLNTIDYGMYTTIDKTKWKLLLRQNTDILKWYILKVVLLIVISICIISLIVLLFINKYLKKIFSKLDKFKSEFKNISNGQYQNSLTFTRFIELNSFIKSFDKMRIELNKREDILTQNLENFRLLVDSTMEGIVIHDKESCLTVNNSAVKILGYDNKSDLKGKKVLKIIPSKYRNMIKECFRKDVNIDEAKEFKLLKKDNSIIYVLAKDKAIYFKNKKLRITLFLDITDLKEQHKIIMEQSKFTSISEMLKNIAHHWRQPLSTISVLSSGMKLEKQLDILNDKSLLEGLDKINKTTKELSSIIDKCSAYFELNKNQERFNLIESLNSTLLFIEPLLQKNEINLVLRHRNKELFINGYIAEFSQIIFNLLENAKDAILNSGVKDKYILIETKKVNNDIVLRIQDSGLGIKENKIHKIFEPYFTTKEQEVGSGIGLYMAHYIITKHMKGSIKIKNKDFLIENKNLKGLEVLIQLT